MNNPRVEIVKEKLSYPNLLAVQEYVVDLVKFCFSLYGSFEKLVSDDTAKNEQLKLDFREYEHYKHYAAGCNVIISNSDFHTSRYNNYDEFDSLVKNGMLKKLSKIRIELNLSYRSGKFNALVDNENSFIIVLEPSASTFEYSANHETSDMREIFTRLKAKLDDFPATLTVFSKE